MRVINPVCAASGKSDFIAGLKIQFYGLASLVLQLDIKTHILSKWHYPQNIFQIRKLMNKHKCGSLLEKSGAVKRGLKPFLR